MTETLTPAMQLCQATEPLLRTIGCHCALTGSTLYGQGTKYDIDIVIYPHAAADGRVGKETVVILDALRSVLPNIHEHRGVETYTHTVLKSQWQNINVDFLLIP